MEFSYNVKEKENCWYKKVCQTECNEDDFCIRHYKMSSLVHNALLEGKQCYSIPLYPEKVDLEAFTRLKAIQKDINNFVKDGKNLLIYSENCGNGKTEWAKKLLLSWFGSIWHSTDFECRGLFISMPKFTQAMKENITKSNEYFQFINDNIATADLVVWDEINYKEWTPFEQEYMLSAISQRIAVGKSNIYTTNFSLPVIEQRLGPRLASRIVGASETIEFKGADYRGVKNV